MLEAGRTSHPWSFIPIGIARLITNPAANWLYSPEPEASTNGRRIPVPRGKLLGGSSSINGMVVRGQAQDFDTWTRTTWRRVCSGRPSAEVSTAMIKGVWPRRPRPAPSPGNGSLRRLAAARRQAETLLERPVFGIERSLSNVWGICGSCGRDIAIERRRGHAEAVGDLGHADVGIGQQRLGGVATSLAWLREL